MDERIVKKNILRNIKKRNRIKNLTKVFVLVLLLAMFLVFLLDRFVITVITVEGNSMQNSFFEGDKILVSKINLSSKSIKSDDIVYFEGNDGKLYIKRIIGVPGDVVEIVSEKVFVNGVQKDESYIKGNITETFSQNKWFISDDEFFVMGDNREKNSSKDSRFFGNIKLSQIKGKVIHNFNSER